MQTVTASPSYNGLVEKKTFTMPSYTTLGGNTIKNVKIGFETYGTLNAARDNAILIAHYFSGTSHAAGRYHADDKEVGYWDAIIGPGKAFDTDKYFVISSDTLVNMNTKDPNVVTTGPASINPDTGTPYGMTFPIVTIRDFVNVQKALIDSLDIEKLHAVAGPSMGSMQAMEWGVAYPDMVDRVLAIIPAGIEAEAYLIAMSDTWMSAIMLDPNWNNGDYYGKQEPINGLEQALKLVTLNGRHHCWADAACGRASAFSSHDFLQSFDNRYAIETALAKVSADRARTVDANSLMYVVKACQTFSLGHDGTSLDGVQRIKAKVLLMPATSDLLMFPAYAKKAERALREAGKHVEYAELEGDGGHFDGLLVIDKATSVLKKFIDN
jgi:homoserine O-acetyltransferase